MNLVDLVQNIDNIDEEQIIFIQNMNDDNSDVVLGTEEEAGSNGLIVADGKTYNYLIEVFLAKDFITDWLESLDYVPSNDEIAKRLFQYAINDS
jgi:hypothetical protein